MPSGDKKPLLCGQKSGEGNDLMQDGDGLFQTAGALFDHR